MRPRNACGYVSLVRQKYRRDPPSVEEQIKALKLWAQEKNYLLHRIIVETDNDDLSEASMLTDLFQRTGIKRLMKDISFNGIILVYDIWRFIKNPGDTFTLAMEIKTRTHDKIHMEFVREGTVVKTFAHMQSITCIPIYVAGDYSADLQFAEWSKSHESTELIPCDPVLQYD